jgi:hypothetical protein
VRKVAAALAALATPLVFVVFLAAMAGGNLPFGTGEEQPSAAALADIPAELVGVYADAAAGCPGMSWSIPAAIGKVESDHGRYGGARLDHTLTARPPIIGIALNGGRGTAAIPDTDGGFLDGDPLWDRAVGPMQFIPSTWRSYAMDGNGDGSADPQNYADAVHTATAYLCANGAGKITALRAAVLAYNHAGWYADKVLALAARYSAAPSVGGVGGKVVGDYALPVDRNLLTLELINRPHHDYPAWDLPLPEGTQAYAVASGTVITVTNDAGCGNGVIIAGNDGAQYTYCHGSHVQVSAGQTVAAGQPLLLSGNTGHSTGPHLHLQIRDAAGRATCPQPLLASLFARRSGGSRGPVRCTY